VRVGDREFKPHRPTSFKKLQPFEAAPGDWFRKDLNAARSGADPEKERSDSPGIWPNR